MKRTRFGFQVVDLLDSKGRYALCYRIEDIGKDSGKWRKNLYDKNGVCRRCGHVNKRLEAKAFEKALEHKPCGQALCVECNDDGAGRA